MEAPNITDVEQTHAFTEIKIQGYDTHSSLAPYACSL